MAPVMTQMPIRKKTVFSSRSWAVFMMVFSMLAAPICQAMQTKMASTTVRQMMPERMFFFSTFIIVNS